MFRIEVPATSANLGAGFDTLGLALSMKNEVYMDFADEIKIESFDEKADIPKDETNLIFKTAKHLFSLKGKDLKGLYIKQKDQIPMARGLGSSSACIVAGLFGANALMGEPFSKDELALIAAKLEGHPDNVAPAVYGGVVASIVTENKLYKIKNDLKDDLSFNVVIPDFELETSKARAVMPKEIPHKDAVFNLGRAALIVMSLANGQYENLKIAAEDKLHQPYRLSLIKGAEEIFKKAYDLGAYCAYISGAGSSLMAITKKSDKSFSKEMRSFLDQNGYRNYKLVSLCANNDGALVEKL